MREIVRKRQPQVPLIINSFTTRRFVRGLGLWAQPFRQFLAGIRHLQLSHFSKWNYSGFPTPNHFNFQRARRQFYRVQIWQYSMHRCHGFVVLNLILFLLVMVAENIQFQKVSVIFALCDCCLQNRSSRTRSFHTGYYTTKCSLSAINFESIKYSIY